MPILSFSFNERIYGWKLNEVKLQDFNLMVGLSGAGKSNILRSLQVIRLAGIQQAGSVFANGCEWSMKVQVRDDIYVWTARVSVR